MGQMRTGGNQRGEGSFPESQSNPGKAGKSRACALWSPGYRMPSLEPTWGRTTLVVTLPVTVRQHSHVTQGLAHTASPREPGGTSEQWLYLSHTQGRGAGTTARPG